jgi:hypothetical protein
MNSCGAWAAGTGSQSPLIEHWNGRDWNAQAIAVKKGQKILSGVAATSTNNAWAVGYSAARGQAPANHRALIMRWNGRAWTRVPSPQGSPALAGELTAVAAASASDAWAVGTSFGATANQTLILHWNGSAWTRQPSPDPAGTVRLTAVTATSASDAWAVGSVSPPAAPTTAFMLHWNGKSWTQVPNGLKHQGINASFGLTSVTAASASNAWAAGNEGLLGQIVHTVILHWNGRVWARQHTPNRPGPRPGHPIDQLFGVTATSASNAWAAGYYQDPGNGWSTLILHWNGRAWRWVTSPNLPGTQFTWLTAIAATSADSAWAVGDTPGQAIVLHWNGTAWQI